VLSSDQSSWPPVRPPDGTGLPVWVISVAKPWRGKPTHPTPCRRPPKPSWWLGAQAVKKNDIAAISFENAAIMLSEAQNSSYVTYDLSKITCCVATF
jgi:hypothetical protein